MRRSVTDPRNGKRVALKKMPNVFQSLTSSKRAYRELKMLCFFKHNNVSPSFSSSLIIDVGRRYFIECRVYDEDNYSKRNRSRSFSKSNIQNIQGNFAVSWY